MDKHNIAATTDTLKYATGVQQSLFDIPDQHNIASSDDNAAFDEAVRLANSV